MEEQKVKIPKFMVASELSRVLLESLPNYFSHDFRGKKIIFDWSDVCFFDDYALLKLIFLQRHVRVQGGRVCNKGFKLASLNAHGQAVLRQIWAVGWPELIASGHLINSEQLKETLGDEADLIESDPLCGMQAMPCATAVVPMMCCHDRKYFTAGSREEKQLDIFLRKCLRLLGDEKLGS